MTKITIDRCNYRCEISVSGHAGYSERGTDIVCAALSILSYALMVEMKRLEYRNEAYIKDTRMELGEFYIEVYTYGVAADAVLDTIIGGYKMLQGNYPSNIRVNIK